VEHVDGAGVKWDGSQYFDIDVGHASAMIYIFDNKTDGYSHLLGSLVSIERANGKALFKNHFRFVLMSRQQNKHGPRGSS